MASRRRAAVCFLALTPVALRAPSVSAEKQKQQNTEARDSRNREKTLTDVDH
jgi:hypothetical protein